MPRPPRLDPDDGWHHVMNRGINHSDIFFADADRSEFGERLADVHIRFGIETHAYCLMTTHFHLLLHCPDGGLSEGMQRLGSIYTRHVNDRIGRDGAIFRGRYRSRLITDDQYLLTACRYIHRNALDLPGVNDVDSYRWSSHRTYLGHRTVPPWMRTDVLLELGGGREQFDRFVRDDGRPEFVARTAGDVRDLLTAVEIVLTERDGSGGRGFADAYARSIVIALAATSRDRESCVTAEALGIVGRSAWFSATHRARAKLRNAPECAEVLERALSLLGCSAHRSRLGSDPNRDQRAARAAS